MHILYSYRRCPYAMRARMALKQAGIAFEVREISLREKPSSLLKVSPKGTVPVLVQSDGAVLEESIDIVFWALERQDPAEWLAVDRHVVDDLVADNDGEFKANLDRYKYPDRFPDLPQADYRQQGEVYLQRLEDMLTENTFLMRETISVADIVTMPFVRQFANVDRGWFDAAPYPKLQRWLAGLLESPLFLSIMEKQPTYLD